MGAADRLPPVILALIRQLAEHAAREDYLALQASTCAGHGNDRPNHPPLPATDKAA